MTRLCTSAAALIGGILAFAVSPLSGAWAADLDVVVTGLRSAKGNVHIAIYNAPERFPDSDGMMIKVEAPIVDTAATHRFNGLAPGRYAIAVYHDENDNDDFDQGFLGIPLEDFAFSNGATVFLGPPSFDDAAFVLGGDQRLEIVIND